MLVCLCASLLVCQPVSVPASWRYEESTSAFSALSLLAQLQFSCSLSSHNQAAVALWSLQLQPILLLHRGLQGQGLEAYPAKSPSLSWSPSGDTPHP